MHARMHTHTHIHTHIYTSKHSVSNEVLFYLKATRPRSWQRNRSNADSNEQKSDDSKHMKKEKKTRCVSCKFKEIFINAFFVYIICSQHCLKFILLLVKPVPAYTHSCTCMHIRMHVYHTNTLTPMQLLTKGLIFTVLFLWQKQTMERLLKKQDSKNKGRKVKDFTTALVLAF